MENRVWPRERVLLDIYQPYKIKDTRDTIHKSLSGTILKEMHKIQVKPLLNKTQKYTRLSRPLSTDLLTSIVTMLNRFSYLRKEIPWEKMDHIIVMIKKVYTEF